MNIEIIVRLIGMVIFSLLGIYFGSLIENIIGVVPWLSPLTVYLSLGILGALVGLGITPSITIRPVLWLRSLLKRISAQVLIASLVGLIVGLIIAGLLAYPLSMLPSPLGNIFPVLGVILFGYLGITVFAMREGELIALITSSFSKSHNPKDAAVPKASNELKPILLDTSVIIDGRIADIAKTGFLPGSLLIPRFVLNELQYIADSADNLRRQRGRRGMEVLSTLQKEPNIPIKISDIDAESAREVDDKLIVLARQLHCAILTNDYNLNRIAELQGVTILNVNELANAVKAVLLPGEELRVRVIQEGKESGQGVGYLDDGTMVVVENGREYLNREITVMVTKILQTAAGRMIFGKPED